MTKDEVGRVLQNIARLLELKGENPFKIRAYVNAARALEGMGEDLSKLIVEGRLRRDRDQADRDGDPGRQNGMSGHRRSVE